MKKTFKRTFAVLIASVMIISIMPFTAYTAAMMYYNNNYGKTGIKTASSTYIADEFYAQIVRSNATIAVGVADTSGQTAQTFRLLQATPPIHHRYGNTNTIQVTERTR